MRDLYRIADALEALLECSRESLNLQRMIVKIAMANSAIINLTKEQLQEILSDVSLVSLTGGE